MAWIYLAGSEGSPWPWRPGSDQSPTVRKTDTVNLPCFLKCTEGTCQLLQSGMTWRRCGDRNCLYPSTLFMEAFPARTLALRGLVAAWKASAADWFLKSFVLLPSSGRPLSSSKTFLLSDPAGPSESSKSWPVTGMTHGGVLFLLPTLERRTCESGGSSLPTPSASRYGSSNNGKPGDGREQYRLKGKASLWTMAKTGRWPTPTAGDAKSKAHAGVSLTDAVKIGNSKTPRDLLPTGQLNPTWVEWLMGYPSGWTALEDWATRWFRFRLVRRSKSSRDYKRES